MKNGYRDCYYMHSYLIYSICGPPKVILRRGHKIMLDFLKEKKRPTYLPKLKLMGRSVANKYILKDGLKPRIFSGFLEKVKFYAFWKEKCLSKFIKLYPSNQKKKKKKYVCLLFRFFPEKKYVCLPYLKFSDPLPKTHIFSYLA